MSDLSRSHINVLKQYPKAIVHLRERWGLKAVGPVLGAGVSRDLGLPDWPSLVKRIQEDPVFGGTDFISSVANATTQVQLLFQAHEDKIFREKGVEGEPGYLDKQEALTAWLRLVHGCLYKGAPDFAKSVPSHPYMKSLVEVIKQSPMTINYNFDSSIEYALDIDAGEKKRKRGYQTITNATAQHRVDIPVIFHPNGFLPWHFRESASDNIVFSDESFADQLIDSMSGQYASLLNHFSRNTCIFVGLSLEDGTLRHLLRQAAGMAPGHYHYYIKYTEKDDHPNEKQKRALSYANFDVYNLITLYLDSEEIKALFDLVAMESEEFIAQAEINSVRVKYVYYLLGSVGVGKSTCLSHLRSLHTYDEWLDVKPEVLLNPPKELTPQEKKEADDWIKSQFQKKNSSIRYLHEGLHVADRCPLDPLTFMEGQDRQKRAQEFSEEIKDIVKGQFIMLRAEPLQIKERLRRRHKGRWEIKDINDLMAKIEEVYGFFPERRCVSTGGKSVRVVLQEVSKIIHMEDYVESDILPALLHHAADIGGQKVNA